MVKRPTRAQIKLIKYLTKSFQVKQLRGLPAKMLLNGPTYKDHRNNSSKKKPNINNFGDFNNPSIFSVHSASATVITIAAANTKRIEFLSNIGNQARIEAAARAGPGIRANYENIVVKYEMTSASPFGVILYHAIMENGETITATNSAEADFLTGIEISLGAESSIYKIISPYREAKYVPAQNNYRLEIKVNLTKQYNQIISDYDSKLLHEQSPGYIESFIVIGVDGKASQTVSTNIHSSGTIITKARPNRLLTL